jgi:hypothetical protein
MNIHTAKFPTINLGLIACIMIAFMLSTLPAVSSASPKSQPPAATTTPAAEDELIKLLREQNRRLKAENAQLKTEIAALKAKN